jgi:isochorismate synthase EntC
MKFSVSTVIHLESSGSRRNTAPNLWQNHAVWHIKSTAWSGSPDGQVLNRAGFRHSLWPIPAFKGTPSEVSHQSSRFIELVLKLGYLVFLVDMIDYR